MIALNVMAQIVKFGIAYLIIVLISYYLILKKETNLFVFIWLIFVTFVPILGSIIYIGRYFLHKNSAHNNV